MKSIGINILLVVFTCVLATFMVEGALRLTSYATLLPFERMPRFYYEPSEAAGYDIARNTSTSTHIFADGSYAIWSNELGCFDEPYRDEKTYTLLVGDSFTWGFAPFEDKWGTLLQTHTGQRVLKCGVPGYGTIQEFAKAKKILSVHPNPSRIVLGYFSNDESDDAAFPNSLVFEGRLIKNLSNDPSLSYADLVAKLPEYAYFAETYCMWNMPAHPALQRVKCFLRKNSIIYVLGQGAVKRVLPDTFLKRVGLVNEEPDMPKTLPGKGHTERVIAFSALAKEHNADFVVVLVPSKEDVDSAALDSSYDSLIKELDAHGIAYMNPRDDFRRIAHATTTPLFWEQDLHLNIQGNHLLGLLVGRYLANRDKLSTQEASIRSVLKTEFEE